GTRMNRQALWAIGSRRLARACCTCSQIRTETTQANNDEAFSFVQCVAITKLVGDIRQHATQSLIATPSLTRMHSSIVRVALRQYVPLRAYRLEHRRNRFSPRTSIGNVVLQKMIARP